MKNNMEQHYYDILGIPMGSNIKEIRVAFYEKAKEFHPDLNGGDELMKKRFQLLTEAYDGLKNIIEEKRNNKSDQETDSTNEYFLDLKLRPDLMIKGGVVEGIEYKDGEFISINIRPGVINEQLLSYTNENDEITFKVVELPKLTTKEKLLPYKDFSIIVSIAIVIFIFSFGPIKDHYLENQRKITVKAIILDKVSSENDSYIIYKNTENNIFKIPNAMKFWDCGKVGDSILVSFKNENNPIFLDVKPLK